VTKRVGLAAVTAVVAAFASSAAVAQVSPAADRPRFELAAIKRCDIAGTPTGPSRTTATGPTQSPGRLLIPCGFSVSQLVTLAYFGGGQIFEFMAPEFPAWTRNESYEINALAAPETPRAVMQGPMLQALLEERFGLKVRREMRTVQMYQLVVASGGSKLQPLPEGSCQQVDFNNPPAERPTGRLCGSATNRPDGPNWMFSAVGVPVGRIVNLLTNAYERPVVDRTGLTGLFDVRLDFSPEGTRLADRMRGDSDLPLPEATAPPLVTALQEQLGLRVESIRGPWEFVVVDAIERPTAN
jgi:uncharacterized protein (TIGR03435 family)